MSMETIYRDYGAIGDNYPSNIFNVTTQKQVYQATHRGDGNRLPLMNRSFISFSYGGKWIEDFNLIATISNNRLTQNGYTAFNDSTTTYDNLDGQKYWGTHYKSNNITFKLATDGIDQKMLDDFLNWFIAGQAKELILSEHPNRAQMARVSDPPQLSLLPFEEHTTMKINSVEYPVTTTLYKGEITLKLVMDDPHWYAVDNILGKKDGNRYIDVWTDRTVTPPQEVRIFASQDALKILYEDGIPLGSMIDNNMLLGNGAFANVENNVTAQIWSIYEEEIEWENGEPTGEGARIEANNATSPFLMGIIAGAVVDASGNGITSLEKNTSNSPSGENTGHFFYSGTAPAPTILQFTFTPEMNSNSYVITPKNKITSPTISYNIITIGSINEQKLYFTTPNILTSYNTAISVIDDDMTAGDSWENMRKHIREKVKHMYVRQWAIKVIDYGETYSITNKTDLFTCMSYFIQNESSVIYPITCSFNSENGEAKGIFSYRKVTSAIPANAEAWISYGTISSNIEEDIGDMIRSNYLIIKDRNYPTSNGRIIKWTSGHKEYSHYIYHDFSTPLTNLSITYKNMYL